MGVVGLPSRVTGFSAISRRQMMTLSDGRHGSANSSQCAVSFGDAWRLTLTMTCFVSAILIFASWSLTYGQNLLLISRRHSGAGVAESWKCPPARTSTEYHC